MEVSKLLKLGKTDYYETHLSIMNCILPKKMTPMEIKVLAAFMSLEGDVALYRFGPTAKKIVMSSVKPPEKKPLSPAGLSNYIGELLEKGFLEQRGDIIEILPVLIPEPNSQTYRLKLENIS